MSFIEKLEALKSQDLLRIECEKEKAEREERAKRDNMKRIEQLLKNIERLKALAQEKLRPKLEVVNNSLLDGKGDIKMQSGEEEISIPEYDSRLEKPLPITFGDHQQFVSLELYWRGDSHIKGYGHGGDGLIVRMDSDQVKVRGWGNSPVVVVSLKEENWEQQFENGLIDILNTPGSCHWKSKSEPSER